MGEFVTLMAYIAMVCLALAALFGLIKHAQKKEKSRRGVQAARRARQLQARMAVRSHSKQAQGVQDNGPESRNGKTG